MSSWSNKRQILTACLGLLIFAAKVQAQSADTTFAAFYNSLPQQPADALQLLRDTSSRKLRSGFAALELHRRSNDAEHAAAAARDIVASLKREPNGAWGHFGLALTLFRAPKTMAIVRLLGAGDGEAIYVAKRHAEKALDRAPAFAEAADLLGSISSRVGDKKTAERARRIIELHRPPPVRVTRPASATEHLSQAGSLFDQHRDREGAASYFEGLAILDSAAAVQYASEAALIASPHEEAALEKIGPRELDSFLRTFWQKRSIRDGVSVPVRLGTHYRRVSTATKRYELHGRTKGAPPAGAVIWSRPVFTHAFDDRGVVFVRYGEPTDILTAIGPRFKANETWVYQGASRSPSVYRFVASGAASGYRLAADARDVIDMGFAGAISGDRDSVAVEAFSEDVSIIDFFSSQGRYTHQYAMLAAHLHQLRNLRTMTEITPVEEVRQRFRDAIASIKTEARLIAADELHRTRQGLENDDGAPRFSRTLPVYHDIAAFRGNGCTDILYTISAPSNEYRLTIGIADTTTWLTQGLDTVVATAKSLGAGHLRSSGWLCMTPGQGAHARITVAVNDSIGASFSERFAIPDYSGKQLMISDLVIALPQEGSLVRGEAKLALSPPRQFRQDEPFRLFYEIYNLPRGGRYRTEITLDVQSPNVVARLLKRKQTMSVSFEGEAAGDGVIQEIRTVRPEVEAGEVILHVRVTDLVSGSVASRKKTIWIR